MSMPRITIGFAVLLILLGVAGYAAAMSSDKASVTALIPAFAGVVFLIFGAVSLANDGMRKHMMHAAAALALLLALAGLGMGAKGVLGGLPKPMATVSQLVMGGLSAGFVLLCIKSFKEARRARQAASAS